jgi:hypothetical protein
MRSLRHVGDRIAGILARSFPAGRFIRQQLQNWMTFIMTTVAESGATNDLGNIALCERLRAAA